MSMTVLLSDTSSAQARETGSWLLDACHRYVRVLSHIIFTSQMSPNRMHAATFSLSTHAYAKKHSRCNICSLSTQMAVHVLTSSTS